VAVNALITLFSLGLFIYWFRYMCLLIVRDRGGRNYAGQVAAANQMMFIRAKALLADPDEPVGVDAVADGMKPNTLDTLEQSLDRDFRVVSYLLRNAAECCKVRYVEQFVLMLDFHLMRGCYRLLRRISRPLAKTALLDMALIVGHLAQSAGENLVARRA
jgi:hypothetical protein